MTMSSALAEGALCLGEYDGLGRARMGIARALKGLANCRGEDETPRAQSARHLQRAAGDVTLPFSLITKVSATHPLRITILAETFCFRMNMTPSPAGTFCFRLEGEAC